MNEGDTIFGNINIDQHSFHIFKEKYKKRKKKRLYHLSMNNDWQ